MDFDPQDNLSLGGIGGDSGFKIGQDKQFGKSESRIGMSSGFGDKSGKGASSLNSLYDRVHRHMDAHPSNIRENSALPDKTQKPENDILEHAQSASVNSTIRKIIKTMDEKKAFDIFIPKGDQTLRNKIKIAKSLVDEIEDKKVGWQSYVHKTKANTTAREILNKGVKGIDGLNVRSNYTNRQASNAIAGTIGELTRNKEIMRRANRT